MKQSKTNRTSRTDRTAGNGQLKMADGKPKGAKVCEDCPSLRAAPWWIKAATTRLEFMRFKLNDSERRMGDAIILITYCQGRESIMVPDLKFFVALVGMEKPNVVTAIHGLRLQRILSVTTDRKGQRHYRLNPDSSTWQSTPRELMDDRDDRLKQLRRLNNITEEGAPNFFEQKPCAKNFGAGVMNGIISDITSHIITPMETIEDLEDEL